MKPIFLVTVLVTIIGFLLGVLFKVIRDKKRLKVILAETKFLILFTIAINIIIAIFLNSMNENLLREINSQENYIINSNVSFNNRTDNKVINKPDNTAVNKIQAPSLGKSDLMLGGIELMTSIFDIKKNIDYDIKIENGSYGIIYFLKDDIQLTVSKVTNKVVNINLFTNKFKTERGVTVGDKEEKILELYNKQDYTLNYIPDINNAYAYEYYFQDKSMAAILRFVIDNESKKIIYIGSRVFKGNLK